MARAKARIIVAGGRDFDDYDLMTEVLDQIISSIKEMHEDIHNIETDIEIVSGMAVGADFLGIRYGIEHNIPVHPCEPQFWEYGTHAGIVRNREMARYASESDYGRLVAFWNGKSQGTKNMIDVAGTYKLFIDTISYSK